jgi:hypothetical protein
MSPDSEIVLPSGAFAHIRVLKARDLLAAQAEMKSDKDKDIVVILITLGVKIDGKNPTYDEVLDMDLRDFVALQAKIGSYLTGPVTS